MNSDRGAAQQTLNLLEDEPKPPAKILRQEPTDPARIDQAALSESPFGDSGAELAPLRGTA